tara:strand:+ start:55 stop:252 length:198 start_codon:yes stop_codon:yes gene_type:complete
MNISLIIIYTIATFGILLIPVGIELTQISRRHRPDTTFHGNVCLAYGTLCGFIAFTGWIDLFINS